MPSFCGPSNGVIVKFKTEKRVDFPRQDKTFYSIVLRIKDGFTDIPNLSSYLYAR